MSEQKTLSLKKKSASHHADVTPSLGNTVHVQKNRPTTSKERVSLYTLLNSIFSKITTKDGKTKKTSVTKSNLKELTEITDERALTSAQLDELDEGVKQTDPELKAVAQIAVVIAKSSNHPLRRVLIEFCARSASGCSTYKHLQSTNIYRDALEKHNGLNTDSLSFLNQTFTSTYDKRISSAKASLKQNSIAIADSDPIKESIPSPAMLESQRDNLIIIGALWLFVDGQTDPRTLINFFTKYYDKLAASAPSEATVAMYLAEQASTAKSGLADTLKFFLRELSTQAELQRSIQGAAQQREVELERLKEMLLIKDQQLTQSMAQSEELAAEIERLLSVRKEQSEDEKAERTHLRDHTGQAKSKAINLLTEDVIEPLRLSLAALKRENPKTEVATYQIELVLENVERELKWFTE
jgi:hypothetical protein